MQLQLLFYFQKAEKMPEWNNGFGTALGFLFNRFKSCQPTWMREVQKLDHCFLCIGKFIQIFFFFENENRLVNQFRLFLIFVEFLKTS